jgi:hypothetical protein
VQDGVADKNRADPGQGGTRYPSAELLTMSEETTPCVRKVPDIEVEERIVYFAAGEWGGCMPLRIFRQFMARAERVIAEHDAKCAEVVPFKKRRGHAAS